MSDKDIALCRQQGHERRTRFQQLWARVEASIAEKDRLDTSLEQLVERIRSEVLPVERQLAELAHQALERLLTFSERKTLGKSRRAALNPWISQLLDDLLDFGQVDDDLRNRLARHHALVLELELEDDSERSDWQQLDSCLQQWVTEEESVLCECTQNNPDEDCCAAQRLASVERAVHATRDGGRRQAGQSRQSEADAHGNTGKPDELVFKRLFRQTAAALHPDKETDAERIREKHGLMTRLLRARQEHDLLTVLQLHEQYVESSSRLRDTDERQLEAALLQHLGVLEKQKHALADRSFLHYMAYHRFHHDDTRVIDARFADYLVQLEQRRQVLAVFLDEVRTLKQLRQRLPAGFEYLHALW